MVPKSLMLFETMTLTVKILTLTFPGPPQTRPRRPSPTVSMAATVRYKTAVPDYSTTPDSAWDKMKVKQSVKVVEPSSLTKSSSEGCTRFVCISDTHNKTDSLQVPAGDVLLHAGDFSNVGKPGDIERFKAFLDSLPHSHKVIIAGNHDITFDEANYSTRYQRFGHPHMYNCAELKELVSSSPGVTYLEDSGTTINGINIWGSPWQPEFYDWAFNLPRGAPLQEKWDLIPENTDVLITHGPPIGHGDLCTHGGRAGCVNLLLTIQQCVRPAYHVFGHIHEGYGVTSDGHTTYINCSTCTYNYRPTNSPIVFDLPNKK